MKRGVLTTRCWHSCFASFGQRTVLYYFVVPTYGTLGIRPRMKALIEWQQHRRMSNGEWQINGNQFNELSIAVDGFAASLLCCFASLPLLMVVVVVVVVVVAAVVGCCCCCCCCGGGGGVRVRACFVALQRGRCLFLDS